MKSLAKLLFGLSLTMLAVSPAFAQREKLPPEDLEYVEQNWPDAKKTTTGIRYVVMRGEGQGEPARPGDKVSVNYVGRLLRGKIFDQNNSKERPFMVRVRRNEVIEGWDQILQLMRKGDKWLVIIPPELAYGTRGQPPDIPRASTLVFEMEILEIERTASNIPPPPEPKRKRKG
ncbi:FKBP-type peptidyl-prolyl cis-trans isomerase [Opitutus sp. ER46]|uniref:FKBP-type peptidyl-prolyl cis-trans isomerase n=1 Tax=Opitutus sp. ER46 TaxID=2161864 RepID=UPI0011B2773E|nr:FKBP-type peptidyl-prolyl cis-trans isomerase [Opitutus sp. ER46]